MPDTHLRNSGLSVDFVDGLWLALIGWFITIAATAKRQTATAEIALAGVRVADVITPPGPGFRLVQRRRLHR